MSQSERRLERFLNAILKNRRPPRFDVGADELSAILTAAALRAVKPSADAPDPRFVDRLGRRLRSQIEVRGGAPALVSRRAMIAGVAAALTAGALGEGAIAARLRPAPAQARLLPEGAVWRPVVALADVPEGAAVRFSTPAVEGFVMNRGGDYTALSAVCTHLGCTLRAEQPPATLSCPCHRTTFSLSGSVLFHQLSEPPAPLPVIPARVRVGMIEVLTL